ncbi:MAG: L-2-amino-thiazoline-4-carboxylic acid hydrolase [Pseudomonadota bacterium]
MAKTELPIFEQRRIEANIIKAIYEALVKRLGQEEAKSILSEAITRDSVEQGQAYAREEGGKMTSILSTRSCLNGRPMLRWKCKCWKRPASKCTTM